MVIYGRESSDAPIRICHINLSASSFILSAAMFGSSNSSGRERWLIEVEGKRESTPNTPSASPVFRHASTKDSGFPAHDCKTLFETFNRAVELYGSNPCLGHRTINADGTARDFEFKTFKQIAEDVTMLGSGLKGIGAKAKASIGILGSNCAEWMVAMQVGGSFLVPQAYNTLNVRAGLQQNQCAVRPSLRQVIHEGPPPSSSSLRPRL